MPDPDNEALHLVRDLSAQDFGTTGAVITESGDILPPTHQEDTSR
jgi:hypothetical protein